MVTPGENTGGGGILIENVRSNLRGDEDGDGPSGSGQDRNAGDGARFPGNGPEPEAAADNIPLDPRILKFSIGAAGNAFAEITRYPGWRFSDEELQAIADALAELGIRMPPVANAILVGVAIGAGKATAYAMWLKAGKPPITESTRRVMNSEPAGGQDNHHAGDAHV